MTLISYWVCKFEWPQEIQDVIITAATPTGTITINDLELEGSFLVWIVLQNFCADLKYKPIGRFCNNTSAVLWEYKGSTSTSFLAARLLRLLYTQQAFHQASSLIPVIIVVKVNIMADIPSRAFKNGELFHVQTDFVAYFNIQLNLSLHKFRLNPKLTLCVISCLHGKALPMESLYRLPK